MDCTGSGGDLGSRLAGRRLRKGVLPCKGGETAGAEELATCQHGRSPIKMEVLCKSIPVALFREQDIWPMDTERDVGKISPSQIQHRRRPSKDCYGTGCSTFQATTACRCGYLV